MTGKVITVHTGRILTAATILVALTACQDQPTSSTPQPAGSASASAAVGNNPEPASGAPRRGPVYQATTTPCELLDHQLLIRTFGPDSGDVTPPQYTRNKILTTMACSRSYGRRDTGTTVVTFRVELADPAAIEAQYRGLRGVQQKRTPLTDAPGLGQAAYTYIDQDTGPHLALYDGNAHLTINAATAAGLGTSPAQTVPVMTQTAQHVLAGLSTRR